MNIYVIVSKRSETYGHGDFGESYRLAMTGSYDSPPPHPAFESRKSADEYIAGLQWKYGLSVMELELTPNV